MVIVKDFYQMDLLMLSVQQSRFRIAIFGIFFIIGVSLGGCSTIIGQHSVEIPLEKLQTGMDRYFSDKDISSKFFNLNFSHPHLTLLPETGRVALDLKILVTPPFSQKSYAGVLAVSGHLYIDSNREAVFITGTGINNLTLPDLDPILKNQLLGNDNNIINGLIRIIPIYNFRAEDLRYAGIQFVPTSLKTTSSGLLVTVEPMR